MPDRNFSSENYHFGYQGALKDDETYGSSNQLDFGDRGYDPRRVQWWSVDPLYAKYPWQSPYTFVGNNPILNREIDGRDYVVFVDHHTKQL